MNGQALEKLLADVTPAMDGLKVINADGWFIDGPGVYSWGFLGRQDNRPRIAVIEKGYGACADERLDAVQSICALAPTLARRVIAAEKLAEALREAQAQLKAVHDDAFKQAIGRGLQTTDGKPFSCLQLNVCAEVAARSGKALAAWEAAQ